MLLYITVDRYVAGVQTFMHAYINMGLGLP